MRVHYEIQFPTIITDFNKVHEECARLEVGIISGKNER